MTELKGTKALQEMIDLALAGVEAGAAISKDGKLGVDDVAYLMKLVPLVGPALSDATQIPAELSDLSAEEAQELVAHVMGKLAIDDAKATAVIGASLKLLLAGGALYKAVKM